MIRTDTPIPAGQDRPADQPTPPTLADAAQIIARWLDGERERQEARTAKGEARWEMLDTFEQMLAAALARHEQERQAVEAMVNAAREVAHGPDSHPGEAHDRLRAALARYREAGS